MEIRIGPAGKHNVHTHSDRRPPTFDDLPQCSSSPSGGQGRAAAQVDLSILAVYPPAIRVDPPRDATVVSWRPAKFGCPMESDSMHRVRKMLCCGPRQAGVCVVIALIVGSGLACAKRTVTRVPVDTTMDLSGQWNDSDSREVSTAMIQDALEHPWITEWTQKNGRKPVVIVGAVRNKTTEHIPVGTFVADIERALINSGRVSIVATAAERGELRSEKQDQWQNATEETAKRMGRELGADCMLSGSIESIIDREGGTKALYYQVDMDLLNIETNEKIWMSTHRIKKVVTQGRLAP